MKQIFVDTNAWIALNSKRDQLHDKAVQVNKNLLQRIFFHRLYFFCGDAKVKIDRGIYQRSPF